MALPYSAYFYKVLGWNPVKDLWIYLIPAVLSSLNSVISPHSTRNSRLYATAETSNQKWEVTTSDIEADRWSYLEVSYHPVNGLTLFLNNDLVGEDTQPSRRTSTPGRSPDVKRFAKSCGDGSDFPWTDFE